MARGARRAVAPQYNWNASDLVTRRAIFPKLARGGPPQMRGAAALRDSAPNHAVPLDARHRSRTKNTATPLA